MKIKVIFKPCCAFATRGFSEMKLITQSEQHVPAGIPHHIQRTVTYVNSFRRTVNGSGMMRAKNRPISATRSMNTWMPTDVSIA